MPRIAMPDVIVLLPGILGSVLEKDGKEIWGISAGSAFRAMASLGGSIKNLELRQIPDEPEDVWEGVTAPRVIPDVHMVPGLWKIDGYTKIANYVKKVFDVTPGQNYFEFPYDWRLPNRVAALRLERMATDWLTKWRVTNPEARLILIGHSMGGLVARYFLEVLQGWKVSRTIITFGTPHRGSLNAVDFVANGWHKKVLGVEVLDLSDLLRSLPSVYELLPTYKCCVVDGKMMYLKDVAIPHLDATKLSQATKFHDDIRNAVEARGTEFNQRVHPVVGTIQPTLQSARFENGVVEMLKEYGGEDMGGDGTVPRVSATPLELSEAGRDMFAAERHASLQNNDAVWAQVQGILETGRLKLTTFREAQIKLSVELDDAYSSTEPFHLQARGDQLDIPPLTAKITRLEDGTKQTVKLKPAADDWQTLETKPLTSGTYRVVVYGDTKVVPVTDVFMVSGP